jgi:molecular chaperone GrpE (heat shock protein)
LGSYENLGKIQELLLHIKVMETSSDDSKTLKVEANKTVSSLINFFANYTELEEAVQHLKTWQMERSRQEANAAEAGASGEALGKFLQRLLQVWDNGWEAHKAKLLQKEDFQALSNLKSAKEKLQTWLSQKEAPNEEEVLRELRDIQSIECFKDWCEIGEVLLTAEELSMAGSQQQHVHLLNNQQLAIANGSTSKV